MLMLPSSMRVFVATEPTDMRKSFNGLEAIVRQRFGRDPLSGDLFVFVNRRGNRMKLLLWDRGGFWLFYKLLERGTFRLAIPPGTAASAVEIDTADLALILEGIDLSGARRRKRWEPAATG